MGSSSKKEKKEKKEKREKKKSKKRKDKKEKHSKKRTRDDSSSSDDSSPGTHVPDPPSVKRPRTVPPSPPWPTINTADEPSDATFCGPERPPDLPREVGPQRPPRSDEEGEGGMGPQRPTNMGPRLPERVESNEDTQKRRVGPSLPEGLSLEELIAQASAQGIAGEEEEEDDVVGPTLPTGDNSDEDGLRAKLLEIERRSLAMKQKMEAKASGTEKLAREEWMVELPAEHVLGMGAALQARTFSSKPQGGSKGDRSQWTDTPAIIAERQAKAREKAMGLGGDAGPRPKPTPVMRESERDKALAAAVDAYNEQRRGQSLMNIHKEKDEGETKWRPFSRETDLNVYRMDGNKRGKMVDEAAKLDSKFARGDRRFL